MTTENFVSKFYFGFYFVCMSACLHVDMCTECVPVVCGKQGKVTDPLGMELQKLVSHNMRTGNLCKKKVCFTDGPSH